VSSPGGALLQVRVAHLGLDRTTNTPVVILQEQDGQRVLPIWIGPAEASAIAMELAGVPLARLSVYDGSWTEYAQRAPDRIQRRA